MGTDAANYFKEKKADIEARKKARREKVKEVASNIWEFITKDRNEFDDRAQERKTWSGAAEDFQRSYSEGAAQRNTGTASNERPAAGSKGEGRQVEGMQVPVRSDVIWNGDTTRRDVATGTEDTRIWKAQEGSSTSLDGMQYRGGDISGVPASLIEYMQSEGLMSSDKNSAYQAGDAVKQFMRDNGLSFEEAKAELQRRMTRR